MLVALSELIRVVSRVALTVQVCRLHVINLVVPDEKPPPSLHKQIVSCLLTRVSPSESGELTGSVRSLSAGCVRGKVDGRPPETITRLSPAFLIPS